VEVGGATDAGQGLSVAALVTGGVGAVYFSNCVQGLMDISNVVDEHAESEGPSVGLNWEGVDDLGVVGGRLVGSS